MAAATKTAKTATGTATRGTAKALRTAGVNLDAPLFFYGDNGHGKVYGTAIRYDRITSDSTGVHGHSAAGEGRPVWLGGVATRFWVEPLAVEAPVVDEAPAAAEPVAAEVTELSADEVIVGGKLLSEMTFPQVMALAKAFNVPGRGTARIAALRAGVAQAVLTRTCELV